VVALGEGLKTQFWRLDNGGARWLTVDLPETMELRHRLLPDGPRQSSNTGSTLDLGWVDGLSPADPILVTAQGLLPYFQRDQVHGLIAGIVARYPARCWSSTWCPRRCLTWSDEARVGNVSRG
jgi:O-methyltransferase involved in polyketide biosynthesis